MKKTQKPLRIHRNTLRQLSADELHAAAAGNVDADPSSGIITRGCSESCGFCALTPFRRNEE